MKSTESCQVASSSQQNPRVYKGGLEQPKRIFYPEEDRPDSNGTQLLEGPQVPTRVFYQGERLSIQNNPSQKNREDIYPHGLEPQPRRRSDMVLPSIERDLPDNQGDQTSLQGETRQVNSFHSYQPLIRGTQQLPAPSIVNVDDYEELPSSKRRRIDDQQPINAHSQARTVLIPIERIDDRQFRYERPHEAVYRNDAGQFVSDNRIVPLPPKEERVRPIISRQEFQLAPPITQMERRPERVADRGERYSQPRDHYQAPLSRSENVENLQFPSRAFFAPPEYCNDSSSFFESFQFAPRRHESSDLGFSSRHDVGVIANSDRVYADSDGMMRRLQPLEVAERSMPSRLSDMSINYRQRDDDRRPDRDMYLPFTASDDSHRQMKPLTGTSTFCLFFLVLVFAKFMTNVDEHAGHATRPLTCANDTAKAVFLEDMEPPSKAYSHDISERQPAATNFDHPTTGMQQLPGAQRQSVWPVKQSAMPYRQPNLQYAETGRVNPFERRVPPPASRAALEPWSDTAFEHESSLS